MVENIERRIGDYIVIGFMSGQEDHAIGTYMVEASPRVRINSMFIEIYTFLYCKLSRTKQVSERVDTDEFAPHTEGTKLKGTRVDGCVLSIHLQS